MKWWSYLFPPPRECWLCSAPVHARWFAPVYKRICATCMRKCDWIDQPQCHVCGRKERVGAMAGNLCMDCMSVPEAERVVNRSVLVYTEWSKRWVKLFKYRGKESLAIPMGLWMADVVRKHYPSIRFTVVTYVPLHPEHLRMRGFNQSERLAAVIGKKLRVPVAPLLERIQPTRSQSKRNRQERLNALENAFLFREGGFRDLIRETVLLVDDVYTTGATVRACAKPLRMAGAKKIYSITFAR